MRWLVALALFALLVSGVAEAGPSGDIGARPGIEGRWRLAETNRGAIPDEAAIRVVHHLFPGGGWIGVTWKAGKLQVLEGTWSHRLDALNLKGAADAFSVSAWIPDEVVKRFLFGKMEVDPKYRWIDGSVVSVSLDPRGRLVLRGAGPDDASLVFARVADPDPKALVGDWTGAKKKSRTVSRRGDGSIETSRRVFGKSVTVKGTWRLDRGRLSIAPATGGDPDVAGLVYVGGADLGEETDRLILLRPQMAAETYERPAKLKPVTGGVVGVWLARGEDGEAEIEFRADGTYTSVLRAAGEVETSGGTWKASAGALLIQDREEGPMRVPYEVVEENVLKLVIEGEALVLTRKGEEKDEPPEGNYPKGLLGHWLARDNTGEISLTLSAGRFTMKARNAMQSWEYRGPWTHQQGFIQGRDENSGQPVSLPYRILTPTQLMITLNGVQVILVKQG